MATIRKRDQKWQVQVRRKGQPAISQSFNAKRDARRWAHDMERAADRGELSEMRAPNGCPTVRDLLERYCADVVSRKRGQQVEDYIVGALLRQPFCSLPVAKTTPAPFTAYRDQRLKNVQGVTVRRELGILQHAFDIARDEWAWDVPVNPIKSIRKPAGGGKRERRLNPGEEERLFAACGASKNIWLVPCVRFAIATAMRRSEILRARWEDVDICSAVLHIPETKNGHPRDIPLTKDALQILKGLPRSISGHLFPISKSALRSVWDRSLRRAEIKDLHFHDLRHEAISRFAELGLSVPELCVISGHTDYRMLARYSHLKASNLVQKLNGS